MVTYELKLDLRRILRDREAGGLRWHTHQRPDKDTPAYSDEVTKWWQLNYPTLTPAHSQVVKEQSPVLPFLQPISSWDISFIFN